MKKTHLQKQKKGFTLIEVIIVVAIIGILSAMVTPALLNIVGSSQAKAISSYGKQYFVGAQAAVTNVNIAIKTGVTTTPFTVKEIKSIYYVYGDNCIFYPGGAGDVKKITTDVALAKSQPKKYTVIPPLPASIPDFSGKTGMGLNLDVSPYIPANSANDNAVLLKNAMQPLLTDPIKAENGGFLTDVKISGAETPPTPPNITTNSPIIVSIHNTKTTNPMGTFIGRAYAMKVANIKYGINYEILQNTNVIGEFTLEKGDIVDLTGRLTYSQTDPIATIQIREKNKPKRASNVATRDLSFYYGNGTYKISADDAQDGTTDFYAISDPESLQMLSDKSNTVGSNFNSKNYKQIATIDMKAIADFTPISVQSQNPDFSGTYDGGAKADRSGFEIRNLKSSKGGLFYEVSNATLKNIGIGSGGKTTGGSIISERMHASTMDNCYNLSEVSNHGSVGAGGLVNYLRSKSSITNSFNAGTVTGKAVGGIVNQTEAKVSIRNCYNIGNVYSTGQLDRSDNVGAGGIARYLYNDSEILNCYNTGIVSTISTIAWDGYVHTGGIVGEMKSDSLIKNNYNTGDVKSSITSRYANTGGIAGSTGHASSSGATVINCFNSGNVSGVASVEKSDRVGGAIGQIHSSVTVTNTKYSQRITIEGVTDSNTTARAGSFTNISTFVNDTGADRASWNDNGQLLNADGTLMAGPNPGDLRKSLISVKSTATTNPTGTFVGRAYALDMKSLIPGKAYTVKLFSPNNTMAYETINLTPTATTHTLDLTGKFTPAMDGANGTHTITVYDGASVFSTTTRDISFYYGNGTYEIGADDAQDGAEDFYAISDPESLQAIHVKMLSEGHNFEGKVYKQIATIDMAKGYKTRTTFEQIADFTPIQGFRGFIGTYDGGAIADQSGYEIRNLRSKTGGLFQKTSNATLKNIGIGAGGKTYGASIVSDRLINSIMDNCYNLSEVLSTTSRLPAAGLVNRATGDTSSIINSFNAGQVHGADAAGIVGTLDSAGAGIKNCYNTGDINGVSITGKIGSIASIVWGGQISNCYNTGTITNISSGGTAISHKFTGGIVGTIDRNASIKNCYNVGNVITQNGGAIGGIVGEVADATITNCFNAGNVSGIAKVGGAIGSIAINHSPTVTNVKYNIRISVTGAANSDTTALTGTYTTISEFVDNTGADRTRWNDNGQLRNADGSLLVGGPNPGDPTVPLPFITVKSTATTNPTGTFVGRAYAADIDTLVPGKPYNVKLFAPNSTTAYETINFTPTKDTHTLDLTGKFKPIMDGANGTHTIVVYDGATELVTTIRDISFYYGNGTYKIGTNDVQNGAEDFYAISDPESLQALSAKVSADNANFATKNYKQIATIDMKPVANFTPIGSDSNKFKGTYDGGAKLDGTGHEIRNLTINLPTSDYVGLFGYAESAVLSNIGITGDHGSIKGGVYVGGIVGFLNQNCTVRNVYNRMPITGAGHVGGIVGRVETSTGTITDAYNTGEVVATGNGWTHAGGIAGANSGVIENVYNTGIITATNGGHEIGGIIGVHRSSGFLKNAYNTGIVNSNSTLGVGGIIGAANAQGNTLNAYSTGNVTGVSDVGGAVGHVGTTPTVTNAKYKSSAIITGTTNNSARPFNVAYTNISEFLNATGNQSSRWNNKGQLLNADGTVMGGPNPGDPSSIITVKSTATTNPTGTFVGRAYAADIENLTSGKAYTVKLFAPNSTTAYETINFTPTKDTHTLNLTGKFKPTMDGANGTHTITVYDGAQVFATTTRDISFYYGNGAYKIGKDDAQNGTGHFYAISDPESLHALSAKVNADNANFGRKIYHQIATIDMAKGYKTPTTFEQYSNFRPIGDAPNPFTGTYNGGAKLDATGYEIRNLQIDLQTWENVGLFGYVENAVLSNIGITGDRGFINGQTSVGSIAGYLGNNCAIRDVYNTVPITASSHVGGIVGQIRETSSTLAEAYNTGKVVGTGLRWVHVGGIAGRNYGSIANVYNTGILITTQGDEVGGIAASNQGSIKNAYNTGTVTSKWVTGVGGILGSIDEATGTVLNVYSTGNVTGGSGSGSGRGDNIGGSVGMVYNYNSVSGFNSNSKYKRSVIIVGQPQPYAHKYNIRYDHISEFVNATGNERSRWNDKGQLLNADGTLMGGPNPGDQ